MLMARGGGAITRDSVFETDTAGVAESVTVITTELVPVAVGVPEMAPVTEAIVNPAGNPVADQL